MKKIAVLSDIHGNYVALQECIKYALNRETDTFILLGDYIGELAYPQKTMDILYSLKEKYNCFFIKGNKENYWIDYQSNGEKGWKEFDSTTGSLYYTYHNLTSRDLEFFKSLSHTDELEFDDLTPLTICHGSPQKVNEKLLPNSEKTFTIMENNAASYILCGHTHIQGKIEYKGKVILNAGAVGISLHGKGKAQFMILQGSQDAWNEEFISLKYDVDSVINDLYISGLSKKAPAWCKITEHILRGGEISHGTVLAKAMALCNEKDGECNWPNVPEEYWNLAISKLLDH